MKPVEWLGDSKKILQSFPAEVRGAVGYELEKIQLGRSPRDSKPMPSIGAGVEEIRIWDELGTYRMIYLARLPEAVYVLHAFQKKSQATNLRDVELARTRLKEMLRAR